MIGLGCAPIYPCLIHSTPDHFGADKSQAIIGIQMACAYVGSSLVPPLFGLIAGHITVSLLPVYLSAILVLMIVMHEGLIRKTAQKEAACRLLFISPVSACPRYPAGCGLNYRIFPRFLPRRRFSK